MRKKKRQVEKLRPVSPDQARDQAFLLNPRNRAYLQFLSTDVHPPEAPSGVYIKSAFLTMLALVASLLFLYSMYRQLDTEGIAGRMEREGVDTTASVIYKFIGGRRIKCSVSFEYMAAGKTYTRSQQVSESNCGRFAKGDEVSIRYFASDPSFALLWGADRDDTEFPPPPFPFSTALLFIVPIALIPLAWLGRAAYIAIKLRRQIRRSIEDGQMVFATVEVCQVYKPFPWSRELHLSYSFTSPASGLPVISTYLGPWPFGKLCPAPGAPLAVLFYTDDDYHLL